MGVDELVSEIAAASQEQSQGIAEINTALTQMDRVTQSNAATAEESAAASEELNAQAASQKQAVASLATLVSGSASALESGQEDSFVNPPPLQRPPTAKRSARPSTNGKGRHSPGDFSEPITAGAFRGIPMGGDFKDF